MFYFLCECVCAQVVSLLLRSGQFSQSYLQRSDMPHNALLLAAKHSHNEVIGLLVKHGFDVNRKLPGANGSCLHEAVLYGRVDTVKYLLQVSAIVCAIFSMCDAIYISLCSAVWCGCVHGKFSGPDCTGHCKHVH